MANDRWVKIPTHLNRIPLADVEPLDDPETFQLYVSAWLYCSAHMTDGVLPRTFGRGQERLRSDLIAAGLLEPREAGLTLVHFLDFNPTREARETALEQHRERNRRYRARQAAVADSGGSARDASRDASHDGISDGPGRREETGEKRKARGAAPPARPAGAHQRTIDLFHRAYQRATGGRAPTWGGAQVAQVKRLLKAHGEDEVLVRMARFFEEQVPGFIWRDGVPDFLSFVQHFDKIPEVKTARRSDFLSMLERL